MHPPQRRVRRAATHAAGCLTPDACLIPDGLSHLSHQPRASTVQPAQVRPVSSGCMQRWACWADWAGSPRSGSGPPPSPCRLLAGPELLALTWVASPGTLLRCCFRDDTRGAAGAGEARTSTKRAHHCLPPSPPPSRRCTSSPASSQASKRTSVCRTSTTRAFLTASSPSSSLPPSPYPQCMQKALPMVLHNTLTEHVASRKAGKPGCVSLLRLWAEVHPRSVAF